jgi:A/G-specific adenine glycosylase
MLPLTKPQMQRFQTTVWDYYRLHGRHDLAWRQPEADGSFDPYKILVSEVMLQQTQVSRVLPKFEECIARFPNVQSLAAASLADVLQLWSGLGYNRRAKFLWQAAQSLVTNDHGIFPKDVATLERLPGIGPNTAAAILVYAFNQPLVFIETNLRTVFIKHFFPDVSSVSDKQILDCIAKTLDHQQPRLWFWALMDYGAYLKKAPGNLNHASASYSRQSSFVGSKRQIRGQVIKALVASPLSDQQLGATITDARLPEVLTALETEGFIEQTNKKYRLVMR